ncbi:hypothetical protein [Microbulbifer hainanensis]|uniref:hypothetical protein n=1 Tax=Microbulbifer hainanensis TaxID=2735675 RepID=UPI001865CF72|nr:hypothetical protein [Microbulbifer hainanensis]
MCPITYYQAPLIDINISIYLASEISGFVIFRIGQIDNLQSGVIRNQSTVIKINRSRGTIGRSGAVISACLRQHLLFGFNAAHRVIVDRNSAAAAGSSAPAFTSGGLYQCIAIADQFSCLNPDRAAAASANVTRVGTIG